MQEINKKIVNLLINDGRMKYREIATKLHISTSTAFNRLQKLFNDGTITRIAPIISDKVAGREFEAVTLLLTEPGNLREVEDQVAHLDQVHAVYDITGEWDALIIAKFSTRQEMDEFIKKIRKIPHVLRTNTSFVLNKIKEDFMFKGF